MEWSDRRWPRITRLLGVVITPGTPEQFGDFIRAEDARWSNVIRTSGIRPD